MANSDDMIPISIPLAALSFIFMVLVVCQIHGIEYLLPLASSRVLGNSLIRGLIMLQDQVPALPQNLSASGWAVASQQDPPQLIQGWIILQGLLLQKPLPMMSGQAIISEQ